MSVLVEIDKLAKSYGKNRVLSNLTWTMNAGTNLVLMGPSGCGKSTLLRLIAGVEEPDQGTIRIGGTLASERRHIVVGPPKRGLALVFQDLGLWPNLTALQNVLLGLAGAGLSRKEKRERAHAAVESCHIASKAGERPSRLSVGEQQRTALARALAVRPKLLLLDEPFTGLDIALRQSLFEEVHRLTRYAGTTVVLVSHSLFDAAPLFADLAVLEEGRIWESGPVDDLLPSPKSQTLSAWARSMAVAPRP
jgi:iron(III) transport system ATP-binding protein